MIRLTGPIALVLLVLVSACSEEEPQAHPNRIIIASVDDIQISETSFQRSYLPVLLYGDKFDSEDNRADMLNYLIGQKLLAEKARAARLDTNINIQRMHDRAESKALARQLYKQWVKKAMREPTESELRQGFVRGQKGLFVRHLFSESEVEIRDYYDRLTSGNESFYTLAQTVFTDSSLARSGGALGWITFGDLDETLEDTVYNMRVGYISQPVKSQYGWHIMALDDSQQDVFMTETDYQINRSLVRNKILERRENLLGKQVLNDFMDQFEIKFNRDITQQVWPIVSEHVQPENAKSGAAAEFSALLDNLDDLLDETLLSVDGEDWSVASILKRLPELERSLLYGNLYVAASNIIRDEMLTREAKRLGLHTHPDVIEEVRDSQDQVLADIYVGQIADTLVFTDAAEDNYYEAHKLDKYHAPDSLHVELVAFSDSLTATKALYQLRNDNIYTNAGDEILWLDASNKDTPLYKLARSIAAGTMAGPVYYKNQWVLAKLLERRRIPLSFDVVHDQIVEDMERERFATTRNLLVDAIRPEHDISINFDLLNR